MQKLCDYLTYRYILMENYFWYRVDDFNDFRKNALWVEKNGVYKGKDPET